MRDLPSSWFPEHPQTCGPYNHSGVSRWPRNFRPTTCEDRCVPTSVRPSMLVFWGPSNSQDAWFDFTYRVRPTRRWSNTIIHTGGNIGVIFLSCFKSSPNKHHISMQVPDLGSHLRLEIYPPCLRPEWPNMIGDQFQHTMLNSPASSSGWSSLRTLSFHPCFHSLLRELMLCTLFISLFVTREILPRYWDAKYAWQGNWI